MVNAADVWYQIGVTSYGNDKHPLEGDKFPGMLVRNAPDVCIPAVDTYTRVSRYCDWIDKTTEGAAKCLASRSNKTVNAVRVTVMYEK